MRQTTRDEIMEKLKIQQPIDIIGIVDHSGAVHGVPRYHANVSMIHDDVFGPSHKRWRYIPGKGFNNFEDVICDADRTLDIEEKDHIHEFLRRRGWL